MPSAKDIQLRPISRASADECVKRLHYSGKVTSYSQLHIGVFLAGRLEGAMQFGSSIDKRRTSALVSGSGFHQFLELNRMAFSEELPRNSESRALAISFRLIAKHAPQVKWIVSFADGSQCGDGTIYRASGFVLTGIKRNNQILRMPDGTIVAKRSLDDPNHVAANGKFGSSAARESGAVPLPGFQFRYVRFIDPTWTSRLTVPVIPFDQIPAQCRMYRGIRGVPVGDPGDQSGEDGASPITPLRDSTP